MLRSRQPTANVSHIVLVRHSVGTDGAKVYRSDDLIGVIPFAMEMISEEQQLKVKKDGLVSQEIKMTPNPNYPQKIEVTLLTEKESVLAAIPKILKTSQKWS